MEDKLFELFQQIDATNSLLSLEDNWDGEGAIKCNPVLLQMAQDFLKIYAKEVFNKWNVIIPAPQINLCKNGTIDLEWRNGKETLLIHVGHHWFHPIQYFGYFDRTTIGLKQSCMESFSGALRTKIQVEAQLLYLLSKIEKWKQ